MNNYINTFIDDITKVVDSLIKDSIIINNFDIHNHSTLLLSNKENSYGIDKVNGDFILKDNKITRYSKGEEIIFYSGLQILNVDSIKNFSENHLIILGANTSKKTPLGEKYFNSMIVVDKNLNFICDDVELDIVSSKGGWFNNGSEKQTIKLPIAHGEGRYHCDSDTLKKLVDNELIALRYKNNPNGSSFDIAGITNEK